MSGYDRDDYEDERVEGHLEDQAIEAAEHQDRNGPDEPSWAGATATHCHTGPDAPPHDFDTDAPECRRCGMPAPHQGPF